METSDEPVSHGMDVLEGETCPICGAKQLTLTETRRDIPYFGAVYIFSMSCNSCKYHKADLECEQQRDPVDMSITVDSENDMSIRVVKSSNATVKIPRIMTIEPGESANGYVTNIEGLLNRVKRVLEHEKEVCEDADDVKKLKNMIKKIQKVIWGQDSLSISLSDPTGNSMIISQKAVMRKGRKS